MKLLFSLFFTHFLLYGLLFGQKKIIDHSAYNEWKTISNVQISTEGKVVCYESKPHQGDGYLYLFINSKLDSFLLGKSADISLDESFVAFTKTPGFDTLRQCKLDKIPKKNWPQDELNIYSLNVDSVFVYDKVKEWKLAEKSNRIAFIQEIAATKKLIEDKKEEKGFWFQKKPKKEEIIVSDGKNLYIRLHNKNFLEKYITAFSWSKEGKQLAMIRHDKKDDQDNYQLIIKNIDSAYTTSFESPGFRALELPQWNTSQDRIVFFASQDTTKEKQMNLFVYNFKMKKLDVIGDKITPELDTILAVSKSITPSFIDNSNLVYIGITERLSHLKDTLLDDEKPTLDVWHYLDKDLQPRQLLQSKNKALEANYYLYDTDSKSLTQLSNDTLRARKNTKYNSKYVLALSNEQYAIQNQWSMPWLNDYYLVNTTNGLSSLLKKGLGYADGLSPKGNFFSYFDPVQKQHNLIPTNSKEEICMTCNLTDVEWREDINGQPHLAGPMRFYGYDKKEETVFFQSEYDVWAYDIIQRKLHCLTQRKGEKNKIKFNLKKWDYDSSFIDLKEAYLIGIDQKSKDEYLYEFYDKDGDFGLYKKYGGAYALSGIQRSKTKEHVILRKMSLKQYPEIHFINKEYENEKVISQTNPQQEKYNWASVEQVSWLSPDSIPLDGLVYLPEDFDSTKKYPLLVYFYELSSDRLHRHLSPRPSASTINPVEYASAGYLVFIPDIRYTHPGQPAKSAYNCIVSGTQHITSLFPVDTTKMGLQGQSWGGYQTAQLITMTDKYAAAMAGAPVSNMFSAYGGIRWGSGLNRQFQYEATQSRIGKTIWEAPELYIENSPLFHLPNVSTPLLIMHNDEDGAVPWYQGIELYNGMRRLGKPCWMLTYNGDDHNLKKNANRIDLSIRMRQFFDYYLQDKPLPHWMKYGLEAKDKETKRGYETAD